MSRTISDTRTVELHVLLADWGEGTSNANSNEGQGAPATPNDATWRHRFYNTIFWTTQGGDFSGTVSASQSVGDIGEYIWSSAQMVVDVQSWLLLQQCDSGVSPVGKQPGHFSINAASGSCRTPRLLLAPHMAV